MIYFPSNMADFLVDSQGTVINPGDVIIYMTTSRNFDASPPRLAYAMRQTRATVDAIIVKMTKYGTQGEAIFNVVLKVRPVNSSPNRPPITIHNFKRVIVEKNER